MKRLVSSSNGGVASHMKFSIRQFRNSAILARDPIDSRGAFSQYLQQATSAQTHQPQAPGDGAKSGGLWNDLMSKTTVSAKSMPQGATFVRAGRPTRSGGPSSANPNRIMNNRPGGGGGGSGSAPRDKSRVRSSGRDIMQSRIPQELQHGLFDFQDFCPGPVEYDDDEDLFDQFFGDVYMASGSTRSGTVSVVIESDAYKRTKLPKPRCMSVLAMSMTPDIRDAPPDSYSYQLAAQAWEVISKNHFYSEKEKDYLCNGIARIGHDIMQKSDYMLAHPEDEDSIFANDMIQRPNFRVGFAGLSREERHQFGFDDDDDDGEEDYGEGEEADAKRAARVEAKRRLAEERLRIEQEVFLGETDWDVEAVTDEDDL